MVYTITKYVIGFFISPFMGKCNGIENIPKNQGAILCANHASYLDHFIIGVNLTKKINRLAHYLAKKEHFDKPIERWWHKNFLKAIPIDRETGGKDALKEAIEHLKNGNLIMIYPEGTRTLNGEMNRAKTGIARLLLAAKVPVIPIGLTNTFKIMPKKQHLPKFGYKADMAVGKPMYFEEYYGKENDKETLRKVTTIIMKEIARLSGQEYKYDEELL